MNKGLLSVSDLNDLKTTGFYLLRETQYTNTANIPSGAKEGTLIVIYNNNNIVQIYVCITGDIHIRSCWYDTWYAWVKK